MSDWKKGELPPVGSELDGVKVFGCDGFREWQNRPYWLVVGHHVNGTTFFVEAIGINNPVTQRFDIKKDGESQWRPIRTEEEKAIEDMLKLVSDHYQESTYILPNDTLGNENWREYLGVLYRAGYRKE